LAEDKAQFILHHLLSWIGLIFISIFVNAFKIKYFSQKQRL